jgi:hypothetical protein
VRLRFAIAVTTALATAAAFAPAASAELGITNYFKFRVQSFSEPPTPGKLTGIDRAYVNHNGTGGAAPGDIYAGGFRFSAPSLFSKWP